MKVRCEEVTAKFLDLNKVKTVISNDFDFSQGGHGLKTNEIYIVMGAVIYKEANYLYYLIDVDGAPSFFPHGLFEVVDSTLPSDWHIQVCDKDLSSNIYYLFGYYELCQDGDYYDKLVQHNRDAVEIYFIRKKQMLG
jgi:hypothetical protein